MRYGDVLGLFLLPPLLALAARRPWRLAPGRERAAVQVALLALVATTPWDNALVARGVWVYGRERVAFTIGYVPFEEYLFFVAQALLVALWLYAWEDARRPPVRPPRQPRLARALGAAAGLALAGLGAVAATHPRGTYAAWILLWAAPLLAGQWAYGGAVLAARWRHLVVGTGIPTAYLWALDALAIRAGVWRLPSSTRSGFELAGLPIEEALFFLLTSLLVVQGTLLFLHPPGRCDVAARTPTSSS